MLEIQNVSKTFNAGTVNEKIYRQSSHNYDNFNVNVLLSD